MSCVKPVMDFRRIDVAGPLNVRETDFFFEVPEFITLPSDEERSPRKLPPSLKVVRSSSYALSGNCNVTYYIVARIWRCDKLVCRTSREIIVIPTTEIPPPLEPEDLKADFELTATSSLGSFWSPSKSLTVTASSSEPRPLVFPTNQGEYGSTEVLLDFKARGISIENEDVVGPHLTNCNITITPEAITYFLGHENESVMSMEEARQSPFAVLKRSIFTKEKRHVHLTGWKRKCRKITCKVQAALCNPKITDSCC